MTEAVNLWRTTAEILLENGSSADKGPQDSSHAQYQEQRPPQQYYDWRPQQPSSTSSYPTSTSHQYQQTSTGSYPGSQASSGQQPYYGQSHRTVDQETGRSPAPGRAADQYTQRQHPSYSRETPWSTQWAWSAAHQDHYISRYNAQGKLHAHKRAVNFFILILPSTGQVEYQWSRSR